MTTFSPPGILIVLLGVFLPSLGEKNKEQQFRSSMIPPSRELLVTLLSHSSSSQPSHLPQKSPPKSNAVWDLFPAEESPLTFVISSAVGGTGWVILFSINFGLMSKKILSPQMVLEQNSEQEGNARQVLPLEITFNESRGCVSKGSVQEARIMWSGALA